MKPILFIDDDQSIVEMLRVLFETDCNVIVEECHSVEDALSAVDKYDPKVVVVDHSLTAGGDEGLKVIGALRSNKDIHKYSYSTGEAMSSKVRVKYLEGGVAEFINKTDIQRIEDLVAVYTTADDG
ncbi:MAG: response regulator [Patescibacteria group bacterium]|nr:response regulator [Patescibacteria group bacterium]MCL5224435.1 response regulator [Patescibacteria group bacterium]